MIASSAKLRLSAVMDRGRSVLLKVGRRGEPAKFALNKIGKRDRCAVYRDSHR
jgi:hypothetical protein